MIIIVAFFVCTQVSLLQDSWRTIQLQAVDELPQPDDDVSLYRLFGFSLFAGISFRKRAVFGRLRKHYTVTKRRAFHIQLRMLQSLVEKEKSVLPACIKLQDRGRMTFPHKDILPFCRDCSLAIKTYLNASMYSSLGRKVIIVQVG